MRLADDVMTGRRPPLLWYLRNPTVTDLAILPSCSSASVNGEAALALIGALGSLDDRPHQLLRRLAILVCWPRYLEDDGITCPLRNISYGGFHFHPSHCCYPLPALTSLPSRIVRAHLAAALGYRSRDSLEYTFHCAFDLPFRKRQRAPTVECAIPSDSSVELAVPPCFLPSPTSMQRPAAASCPSLGWRYRWSRMWRSYKFMLIEELERSEHTATGRFRSTPHTTCTTWDWDTRILDTECLISNNWDQQIAIQHVERIGGGSNLVPLVGNSCTTTGNSNSASAGALSSCLVTEGASTSPRNHRFAREGLVASMPKGGRSAPMRTPYSRSGVATCRARPCEPGGLRGHWGSNVTGGFNSVVASPCCDGVKKRRHGHEGIPRHLQCGCGSYHGFGLQALIRWHVGTRTLCHHRQKQGRVIRKEARRRRARHCWTCSIWKCRCGRCHGRSTRGVCRNCLAKEQRHGLRSAWRGRCTARALCEGSSEGQATVPN